MAQEPLLTKLPYPVAYFLGYRHKPSEPLAPWITGLWVFSSIFAALTCIIWMVRAIPAFEGGPTILGSLFCAISGPLSQPKNAFFSQVLASVLGICIQKLFRLSSRFDEVAWVGGVLSCSLATTLMFFLDIIHPPAGATALLAVVDTSSHALGWYFVPLTVLSVTVMLGLALFLNNIQRQFPLYWWNPPVMTDPRSLSQSKSQSHHQHQQHQHNHSPEFSAGLSNHLADTNPQSSAK